MRVNYRLWTSIKEVATTITIIKFLIGVFLMIGGVGLQARSKNRELYDFIYGTEAVIAGIVIIATE